MGKGAFGVTKGYKCPTCGFEGQSLITEMSPGFTQVKALRCGDEGCRENWELGYSEGDEANLGQQRFEDPDPAPEGVTPYPEELHAE